MTATTATTANVTSTPLTTVYIAKNHPAYLIESFDDSDDGPRVVRLLSNREHALVATASACAVMATVTGKFIEEEALRLVLETNDFDFDEVPLMYRDSEERDGVLDSSHVPSVQQWLRDGGYVGVHASHTDGDEVVHEFMAFHEHVNINW